MPAWLRTALRRLLQVLGLAKSSRAPPPAAPMPAPPTAAAGAGPRPLESGSAFPELGAGASAPALPTLAMPELFAIAGAYPTRDAGGNASFTMAMIQPFAGGFPAFNAPRAEGQLLPVNGNPQPFSLLGTSFGGNGQTTFALPNLNGRIAVGGTPLGLETQVTLTLTYMIVSQHSDDAPLPGMVALFAAGWAPDGWLVADGSLLSIPQNAALFSVIGTTFGGNFAAFALPNLNGAAAVGAGDAPGLPAVALGQPVSGPIPALGLNYLIALYGAFPSGGGGFPQNGQYIGQVIAYAGAAIPPGWALCDGSLLMISDYATLFQVIGTTYGGDGEQTFALPDLRGRMVVGLAG